MRRTRRRRVLSVVVAAVVLTGGVALADPTGPPVDFDPCTPPAGEAAAYSPEWQLREVYNVYCSWQGNLDRDENPAFWAAYADMLPRWMADDGRAPLGNDLGNFPAGDPFRYPATRWNGTRGQYRHVWIPGPSGARLSTELFAPLAACSGSTCKTPPGLKREHGPYPVVVFEHGGGAQKEPWWFIAEALAESGYVVVLFDAYGQGGSTAAPASSSDPAYLQSARAALDYALATPSKPTTSKGVNPFWKISDGSRVGVGGQSMGAITMNYVGQLDKRVDAIASYDSCERFNDAVGHLDPADATFAYYGCRSDPTPLTPKQLRTPMLQLQADGTLIGTHPQPLPNDPHRKDAYYRTLRAQGIETVQINFRAASHNDSAFVPGPGPFTQTRFGQILHIYYTKAWFDYQLKGTRPGGAALRSDACRRLTARAYDNSADPHSIGTGWFDATRAAEAGDVLAGNVPPTINGLIVKDRLSYHYLSGYYLDKGRVRTDDMRFDGPSCRRP